MPRIVKDPDVRRNEILDAAQQLFAFKGYDQTSVQDVLDAAGISRAPSITTPRPSPNCSIASSSA